MKNQVSPQLAVSAIVVVVVVVLTLGWFMMNRTPERPAASRETLQSMAVGADASSAGGNIRKGQAVGGQIMKRGGDIN